MKLHWIKSYIAGAPAEDAIGVHFAFNSPLGLFPAIGLLVIVAVGTMYFYRRGLGRRVPRSHGILLTALRTATVTLVLFLFLDPCLVGERIHPGEEVVALLFDDSRSMQVAGPEGRTRGNRLQEAYKETGETFENQLSERFSLVRYAFGLGAERIKSADDLSFQQPKSDLVGAVEAALRDLAGANVSAVVLVSDGVQQPTRELDKARLESLGTPVFTVGMDTGTVWRDLQLTNLSVRRTNFDKSPVIVTVRVHAEGLDGESVVVEILDENRVIASKTLTMNGAAAGHEAQIEFIPTSKGWRSYQARVQLVHDDSVAIDPARAHRDQVAQNNNRHFLVDNRDKQYRILYFSGSPTWENKFFRRALAEDKQLRLTSLIRVSRAEKRFVFRGQRATMSNPLFAGFDDELTDQPRYDQAVFLRLGADGSELTSGYPEQAEDLFAYDLVIWADIEHHFFSPVQLERTKDFVEKRGGTLLLLGGPRSFAEGGFGGTVIDGMLPVVLRAVRSGSRAEASSHAFTVVPTIDGVRNGAWTLGVTPEDDRRRWSSLPGLFGLNAFPLTRAGTSVMAQVYAPGTEYHQQPFFAVQRYGEGQCALLATGRTWPWRMGAADEDDAHHERLWRQLVRTLVDGAPEALRLRNKADGYTVGESSDLEWFVKDPSFVPRDGLRVTLQMTTPDGESRLLDIDESIRETGLYTSSLTPDTPGPHRLTFSAFDEQGEALGTLEEQVTAEPDLREFQNARHDAEFLKHLAQVTGGQHGSMADLPRLAEQVRVRPRDTAERDLHRWHLWHWPPFLGLLVLLLCSEWYVRRRRGYP